MNRLFGKAKPKEPLPSINDCITGVSIEWKQIKIVFCKSIWWLMSYTHLSQKWKFITLYLFVPSRLYSFYNWQLLFKVDARAENVEQKVTKLENELRKLKDQMAKMREGPAKNNVKQKALRLLKQKKM